jgi:hypothetical protein
MIPKDARHVFRVTNLLDSDNLHVVLDLTGNFRSIISHGSSEAIVKEGSS